MVGPQLLVPFNFAEHEQLSPLCQRRPPASTAANNLNGTQTPNHCNAL